MNQPAFLTLDGGYVYAITNEVGQAQIYPQVYQLNTSSPSTSVARQVAALKASNAGNQPPSCVMDGKLFWAGPWATGQYPPTPILVCSLSNCAATTTTLLTSPGQMEANPYCDTTADEIVWEDYTNIPGQPPGGSDWSVTVYRASSNGTNMRATTSFLALGSLAGNGYITDLGIPHGATDRYFFTRTVSATQITTLYYVLTNAPGVTPVSIATGMINGSTFRQWSNDSVYVWVDGQMSADSFFVPLPDGVAGMPAVFYPGAISTGVSDQQNLYGTFSTLPADAIGVCPLSNCSSPTILFRGQQNTGPFAEDGKAIYWTTTDPDGFIVWKGAK